MFSGNELSRLGGAINGLIVMAIVGTVATVAVLGYALYWLVTNVTVGLL